MNSWYYNNSGVQQGPVGDQEIRRMLDIGDITADTLLWCQGMSDWQPVKSVPEFRASHSFTPPVNPPAAIDATALSPYAPPASELTDTTDWSGYIPDGPQVRPWVRYWARTCDFLLFCVLFGMLVMPFVPRLNGVNDSMLTILLLLTYNFVEPVMLATIGTTPFKGLMRVRLRNSDGTKLSYLQALRRAFSAWIRGQGTGIPLVSLFTHLNSYNRLKQDGSTLWDRRGDHIVTHKAVGWRWLVLIAFLIAFAWLIALGNSM